MFFAAVVPLLATAIPLSCAEYTVVIDAGSKGSRVHVYQFDNCKVVNDFFKKVEPGLSSYSPLSAANSLDPLVEYALMKVPKMAYKATPLVLRATAGLRLLPANTSHAIVSSVRAKLSGLPFLYNSVDIFSGIDEGLHAWIAVNYLLKSEKSTAIIEVGGASAQIAFEDSNSPLSVAVNEEKFRVFSSSLDGYGIAEVRNRVLNNSNGAACIPRGLSIQNLVGTGTDFGGCFDIISGSLFTDQTPMARISSQIYALSTISDFFAEPFGFEKGFLVSDLRKVAQIICSPCQKPNWPVSSTAESCLDVTYFYTLLTKKYRLSDDQFIQAGDKIDGFRVKWALGLALQLVHYLRHL
jgi:Golgi nucleoside diphosphatase